DAWNSADQRGMAEWCGEFLQWLRTSEFGRGEEAHPNNHGTAFDVQAAGLALLTGQLDVAKRQLEQVPARRIDTQIEPDGRQPKELERTLSLTYTVANLGLLTQLARLGEHLGMDLWHYRSADGRSI